jgi:hypothetical protein
VKADSLVFSTGAAGVAATGEGVGVGAGAGVAAAAEAVAFAVFREREAVFDFFVAAADFFTRGILFDYTL